MKKLSLFFFLSIVYFVPTIGQIVNPNNVNYEIYADEWRQECDNDWASNDDNMVRIAVTTDGSSGGTITWNYTGTCTSPYAYVRRWAADAPTSNVHANSFYSRVNSTSTTGFVNYTVQSWESDNGFNCLPVSGDDCRWGPVSYTATYRNASKTPNQWWGVNGTSGNGDWSAETQGRVRLKTIWRYTKGSSCSDPLDFGTLASGVSKTHFNSNRATPAGARAEMGYTNVYGNSAPDVYYTFSITQPSTVVISTIGGNSNYDTYLRLFNSDCSTQIEFNDDFGGVVQSQITRNLCAGTYKILVEGFSGNSGNFELSVLATTISANGGSIATTTTSVCSNTMLSPFTSSANASGLGTTSYQWESSTTSSTAGFSNITGETTVSYSPSNVYLTQTTWYRRRATDECGRVSYSNTIQIIVNTASTAPTAITGTNTICNGASTTLTATGMTLGTGATVQWFEASCGSTVIGTGNSIIVTPTNTATYYARVTGTCNTTSCASTTVTVNTLSTAPTAITGTNTICNGASTTLTATGMTLGTGATVQWFEASCGSTVIGTGNSIIVTPTNTATYYARVTGTCNTTSCASTTVTINTLSTAPTAITGTNTICNGASTTLIATGMTLGTGATVQWFEASCGSTVIGTGNSIIVTPTNTATYYARVTGTCNTTSCASTTVTVNTLSTAPTAITGTNTICNGASTTLTATGMTLGTGATVQWFEASCGSTVIGTGNSIIVTPTNTATYYARVTGTCNTTSCASTTVTVNTLSSALTLEIIPSIHCPNTNITITANATLGTGANIRWYTAPNGSGTLIATGNTITVAPISTTIYYARIESPCGNSADVTATLNIREFVYAANNTSANNYCTDNDGWHHFYNGNQIILSVRGDISNLSSQTATIRNNATYYQDRPSGGNPANCINNFTPGEERFEMSRNWNIFYTGSLSGTYQVRFYHSIAEKNAIINAALNFATTNSDCGYNYKYNTGSDGFYWFKNASGNYTAPVFEDVMIPNYSSSTVNGINYTQLDNISSFSGGSGAVILVPNSTLPIELLSFDGIYNQGKSYLNWVTASEFNNSYFEIQRSASGANDNFQVIGIVNSLGDSHSNQSYNFIDEHPYSGINYYRLRQVDFDGSFTYSNIIALESPATAKQQIFYPNPTTSNVTYQFTNEVQEKIEITIINTLGQIIDVHTYNAEIGNNQIQISLDGFASGVYIINAKHTNANTIISNSIIKTN